jgi:hypothetical protein
LNTLPRRHFNEIHEKSYTRKFAGMALKKGISGTKPFLLFDVHEEFLVPPDPVPTATAADFAPRAGSPVHPAVEIYGHAPSYS